MSRNNRNVVKYRRPFRLNVGSVIFLFIFIYLVIIVISFFSSKRCTIYEVVEKSIADNNTCSGVIIRNELVNTSATSGYINFYVKNGDRIARNSTVYSVDESGKIYDMLVASETDKELSSEDSMMIRNDLKLFQNRFRYSDYQEVTDLRYNLEKAILDFSHLALSDAMKKKVDESDVTSTFQLVPTKMSGIFSSTLDGFEDISVKDVDTDTFKKKIDNHMVSYESAVTKGTPIYKMITSEDWSLVLNLSQEQYQKLQEKQKESSSPRVSVRFMKDGRTTTAPFELEQKGDGYFAILTFQKYMQSYLDDRFLDVELILHSADGLKIPKSALLEKEFYMVPLSFFTTAGENSQSGLVEKTFTKSGEVKYEFVATTMIAKKDDEYAYIEKSNFNSGTVIQNAQTQEEYTIGKTGSLTGVYNVNKGYCVFRQVELLYENEEYCIVKDDTYNGLCNYDHILLDSTTAQENEIIK